MRYQHTFILMLLLLLSACFHDDGTGDNFDPGKTPDALPQQKSQDYYHLISNTDGAFDKSLRAYLASALSNNNYYRGSPNITFSAPISTPENDQSATAPTNAGSATGTASATAPNVSQTNVIEQGVDESDLIKSDGEFLFVVNNPQPYLNYSTTTGASATTTGVRASNTDAVKNEITTARLRVYALDTSTPAANELTSLDLPIDVRRIEGIYLDHNPQAATRQLILLTDVSKTIGGIYSNRTRISSYDFSTIETPQKTWQLEIEGSSIASRIVNGKLLFLSRKQFDLKQILGAETNPQTAEEIDTVVNKISAQDILPYSWLNETQTLLVTPTDCIVPLETNEQSYFDFGVTSILTIPLNSPETTETICTLESTAEIYVSSSALYLTKNDYLVDEGQGTLVHKFAINDSGLSYRASGRVSGTVGWRNTKFRMSEYEDYFRIVTSQYEDDNKSGAPVFWAGGNMTHHLYILKEDKTDVGQLTLVSQLPNADHPKAIGKPGEQIYGVRFFGKFGYVVTFKKVDPLYVLNLGDPENPAIDGELELPGYSDYLHPISDNLLIGVGKDAIEENGTTWFQGLKVGIFDVSDKKNPKVVQEALIGKRGTDSIALSDYHAFTFIQNNDSARFAFPVSVHDNTSTNGSTGASTYYDWQYSGLKLYELANITGNVLLTDAGIIENATNGNNVNTPFYFSDSPRALFVDDAIFFTNAGEVWAANWFTPTNVTSTLEVTSITGYLSIEAIGDPGPEGPQQAAYSVSITDDVTKENIYISVDSKVNDFLRSNNTYGRLVIVEGIFLPNMSTYRRSFEVSNIGFKE